MFKDAIGREWQLATAQVDFNMPERFKLSYVDKDGIHKTPVMIHRALLGSMERFIGILLEHYAGDLPLWLNPQHVKILPISEKFHGYCYDLKSKLDNAGIITEIDARNEKIGKK